MILAFPLHAWARCPIRGWSAEKPRLGSRFARAQKIIGFPRDATAFGDKYSLTKLGDVRLASTVTTPFTQENPMNTFANPATTHKTDSVRPSRCFRRFHARHSNWKRVSSLATLALAVSLILAPPASAVDYSTQYYNSSTDYNVKHWSSWYVSRGAEASATPLAFTTICAYSATGAQIECQTKQSWSNRIDYPRQTAINMCVLGDIGWGGSRISLICYQGT